MGFANYAEYDGLGDAVDGQQRVNYKREDQGVAITGQQPDVDIRQPWFAGLDKTLDLPP